MVHIFKIKEQNSTSIESLRGHRLLLLPVETSKLDLTQTNSVGAELLPVDEDYIRNRLIL